MKRITRWSPDTCGCVIDLEWDDEHPSDQRTHVAVAGVACDVHRHHEGDVMAMHAAVHAENAGKNAKVARVIADRGVDPDHVRFAFTETRQVRVLIQKGDGHPIEVVE